mgnify:CR=1 FL=1|jgi:hypothetical protein
MDKIQKKVLEYNKLMQTKEMQEYSSHPDNRLRISFKTEEEGEALCERARSDIKAIQSFVRRKK